MLAVSTLLLQILASHYLNYAALVLNISHIGGEEAGFDFIDGYVFLERFYSVFDTTNSRVGFATTSFTVNFLAFHLLDLLADQSPHRLRPRTDKNILNDQVNVM